MMGSQAIVDWLLSKDPKWSQDKGAAYPGIFHPQGLSGPDEVYVKKNSVWEASWEGSGDYETGTGLESLQAMFVADQSANYLFEMTDMEDK